VKASLEKLTVETPKSSTLGVYNAINIAIASSCPWQELKKFTSDNWYVSDVLLDRNQAKDTWYHGHWAS
jgi:hypothetical protein